MKKPRKGVQVFQGTFPISGSPTAGYWATYTGHTAPIVATMLQRDGTVLTVSHRECVVWHPENRGMPPKTAKLPDTSSASYVTILPTGDDQHLLVVADAAAVRFDYTQGRVTQEWRLAAPAEHAVYVARGYALNGEQRLVYSNGSTLFVLNLRSGQEQRIEITCPIRALAGRHPDYVAYAGNNQVRYGRFGVTLELEPEATLERNAIRIAAFDPTRPWKMWVAISVSEHAVQLQQIGQRPTMTIPTVTAWDVSEDGKLLAYVLDAELVLVSMKTGRVCGRYGHVPSDAKPRFIASGMHYVLLLDQPCLLLAPVTPEVQTFGGTGIDFGYEATESFNL